VRRALSSDIAQLLTMNELALPHVTSMSSDRLAHLLDVSRIALVVEEAGAPEHSPIGFCLVLGPGVDYQSVNYQWVMDRYEDALYLDRVVVDAHRRGQGVGQRIYAEVQRLMRSDWLQFPRLALEVNLDPPNPESLAFHRKLGFEPVGEQTTPYGARVLLMAKHVLEGKTDDRA
jgi:hypothetical protein